MPIVEDTNRRKRVVSFVANLFYITLLLCVFVQVRSRYNFSVLDRQRHKYNLAEQAGAKTEELTARYVMVLQAEDAAYEDPLTDALDSKTGLVCMVGFWGMLLLIRLFPGVAGKREERRRATLGESN